MKSRIRGKKGGGWETTRCRTPTQSWNEKDPSKDALKKWSKYPKTAKRGHLPRSHRAKEQGTWPTLFTADWQVERIKLWNLNSHNDTEIHILACRDCLLSNPMGSLHLVIYAFALPFNIPLALLLITAMHSAFVLASALVAQGYSMTLRSSCDCNA